MIGKNGSFRDVIRDIYRAYKNIIVVIILGLLVAVTFGLLTITAQRNTEVKEVEDVEALTTEVPVSNTFQATEKNDNQKVYISGEVVNPGVYDISLGDRIEDIINYAGGITKDANVTYINLAEKVTDEQHIIIPSEEEAKAIDTTSVVNQISTNSKININKATISELTQLSGIGEVTAKSIVEFREANGNFTSIDDIKKVSGIGEKTFKKFKDQIDIK